MLLVVVGDGRRRRRAVVVGQIGFTMPPQITCAYALLAKRGKTEIAFFSQLTLPYDSVNLVVNAFSSGLMGAWFRRNEVESASAVGLCCTHNAPMCCLSQGNDEALDR